MKRVELPERVEWRMYGRHAGAQLRKWLSKRRAEVASPREPDATAV